VSVPAWLPAGPAQRPSRLHPGSPSIGTWWGRPTRRPCWEHWSPGRRQYAMCMADLHPAQPGHMHTTAVSASALGSGRGSFKWSCLPPSVKQIWVGCFLERTSISPIALLKHLVCTASAPQATKTAVGQPARPWMKQQLYAQMAACFNKIFAASEVRLFNLRLSQGARCDKRDSSN